MSELSEQEIWKIIDEFPDYQISNLGNVKNRLNNKINKGSIHSTGYRIHRFYFSNAQGTKHIKDVRVHMIVAQYFVDNEDPINKKIVQFIDSNKLNLSASNLQWISQEEYSSQEIPSTSNFAKGKPVCEYDLKGCLIRIWASATAVSKIYPISARAIHDPCKYKTKTAYGRQWRYYESTKGQGIPSIQLRAYDLNLLHNKLRTKVYVHDTHVPEEYLFVPTLLACPMHPLEKLITHSSLSPLQKQDLRQIKSYILQLEDVINQLAPQIDVNQLDEDIYRLIDTLSKDKKH